MYVNFEELDENQTNLGLIFSNNNEILLYL